MGGGEGSLGCGGLLVVLAIAYFTGADPSQLLGGLDQIQQGAPQEQAAGRVKRAAESCAVNAYSTEACAHLDSLNKTWEPKFKAAGIAFEQPCVNFYSSVGPFGLRRRTERDGAVLLPERRGHLYRHRLLRRDGPAHGRQRRFRARPM